ncbi:protein lethal(2)denticleless [Thrips palmi]|uniref:Protein lethal(2)denticleless n=1 Tax=Thrips palmi TaxID=161013 RepID=A0A6P9ABB3_THRPL|nr:protein lethal(2)denticleless [Thrips palmi]
MNIVDALNVREQGKRTWSDYRIALRRLKCHDYDEFRGIVPSTEGPDFNPEPPVFACTFCTTPKNEHLLALANEDGKIALQNTNLRSDHNPFEGHQAHHNAIFDIAWAPGEMKLVSASGDHTAVLWDVQESGNFQEVARFHAHTRSVKTVAFPHDDKMMFATGARDGVIMLWDTRIQRNQLAIRPDNFISNSHSAPGTPGNTSGGRNRRTKPTPSRASSITGLAFQDAHSLISCGAGDGKVKVWDIRKSYSTYRREPQPQYSMSTPNGSGRSGFTCLALDPSRLKLYASCMDNTIYCYNVSTYEEQPVSLFKGHKNSTFYVKACLSPDGRYLLSGSSDEHAYIWDTSSKKGEVYLPIVKLVGHNAEVTSVAWCPIGEVKIVTCSDDARHCMWRVGQEFRGDNHQVELHGWAEDFADGRSEADPSTPATPITPSFTSWRRWTPCVQRTPDNEVEQPSAPCTQCHRLSTPCLRCIATRAPLPLSAPHGSKKRLEVLWEEDSSCPECVKEARPILNQVPDNVAGPGRGARRLFSPARKHSADEVDLADTLGQSPSKKPHMEPIGSLKRPHPDDAASSSCPSSPKKHCTLLDTATARRTSPRKRCHPSEMMSPQKKFKVNENASCSKDETSAVGSGVTAEASHQVSSFCSPKKDKKTSSVEDQNVLPGSSSSPRKPLDTPSKRRISDRRTDSPHKRLPHNDDLQGIGKIEDAVSQTTQIVPKKLCARHSRMGFNSPTLNLPNYVLDGTSPHHRCSPGVHHKENVDWLTRLRRERNSTDKKEPESASDQDAVVHSSNSRRTPSQTTPGKGAPSRATPARASLSRVTPAKSSSRTTPGKGSSSRMAPVTPGSSQSASTQTNRKTPSRRSSNSDPSASGSSSNGASTSLLKFFRVSDKSKEQQCSRVNPPAKPFTSVVS